MWNTNKNIKSGIYELKGFKLVSLAVEQLWSILIIGKQGA